MSCKFSSAYFQLAPSAFGGSVSDGACSALTWPAGAFASVENVPVFEKVTAFVKAVASVAVAAFAQVMALAKVGAFEKVGVLEKFVVFARNSVSSMFAQFYVFIALAHMAATAVALSLSLSLSLSLGNGRFGRFRPLKMQA